MLTTPKPTTNKASLAEVIAVLDSVFPARLAESWDTGIGLTCGDPSAFVDTVLLAVDVDPKIVAEAIELGAQLLLTHHPMLFRPVQSVAANTAKGALIHRLGRAGIAHFAAHTNADRAAGGVNDALASTLGLQNVRPLQPADDAAFDKLVVFVPRNDASRLIDALAAAGAGRVGNYSHAAFFADGTGQFLPLAGAHPTIGTPETLEHVDETRIDMVLPRSARLAVLAALRAAHPYEEPGFDITAMVPLPSVTEGLGRVAELAEPMPAGRFTELVAAALPSTVTGARLAGDPERQVRRVAVCGGSGGSLLGLVAEVGVDAFVTADLSHHVAAEYVCEPTNPVLVEVSHWASEWPWLKPAADLLGAELGVRTIVSELRTDPWTFRADPPR